MFFKLKQKAFEWFWFASGRRNIYQLWYFVTFQRFRNKIAANFRAARFGGIYLLRSNFPVSPDARNVPLLREAS